MPAPDDLQRTLHVFIHDLRAPISVAVGFVRLVREHRLPDEAARERALTQTMDALGRLSGLCDQASELLGLIESPEPRTGRCPVARLTDAIAATLVAQNVHVEQDEAAGAPGSIAVANADRMAAHVGTIVSLSQRYAPGEQIVAHIAQRDGWLRVVAGPPSTLPALDADEPTPLDPWEGGLGLALALSCLDLARHGGRAWTTARARPGVALALPVQEEQA